MSNIAEAPNNAEAAKTLKRAIGQAKEAGFVELEFDARLAFGIAGIKSGNYADAGARLDSLEKDARAKGFGLIVRKAAAARREN